MFFDSHSHGKNGLSSSDGYSIIISFPKLEDVVTYLYAFYNSLAIDLSTQFDLLPLICIDHQDIEKNQQKSKNLLEAYFKDQSVKQHRKNEQKTVAKKK